MAEAKKQSTGSGKSMTKNQRDPLENFSIKIFPKMEALSSCDREQAEGGTERSVVTTEQCASGSRQTRSGQTWLHGERRSAAEPNAVLPWLIDALRSDSGAERLCPREDALSQTVI